MYQNIDSEYSKSDWNEKSTSGKIDSDCTYKGENQYTDLLRIDIFRFDL